MAKGESPKEGVYLFYKKLFRYLIRHVGINYMNRRWAKHNKSLQMVGQTKGIVFAQESIKACCLTFLIKSFN